MADRYWVGGTGAWSGTNTANWSASDGGASGASVPTLSDNVFFTANSNTGTGAFTVTVTTVDAVCANFDSTGIDGVMTIASRNVLVYGDLTLSSIMLNSNSDFYFRGTGAQTVNTNGVTMTNMFFQGTLSYTLLSAVAGAAFNITSGTVNTNNFNLTLSGNLGSSGATARTLNLGSSIVQIGGLVNGPVFSGSNFTFNAGTSLLRIISIRNYINVPTTTNFYDVELSFLGSNLFTFDLATFTCRNLTFKAYASGPQRQIAVPSGVVITVTGTFTCEANATRNLRTALGPDPDGNLPGVRGIINAAAYNLNDIDIFTVAFGGAGIPVTGTSIGDSGNTTNVTFTASKTVYKTSASTSWSGNTWSLSSGGSVDINNYPLPQDTVIIDNNSGASVTTSNLQYAACQTLDASTRTTTFTLTVASGTVLLFGGNGGGLVSNANLVVTNTSTRILFSGSGTQSITSPTSYATTNTASTFVIYKINGGDVRLNNNLTTLGSINLTAGGLDLNGFTFKCNSYVVNTANAKTLTYGSGGLIESIPVLGSGFCFTFSNATLYTVNADVVTGLRPLLISGSVPTLTLSGFMDLSPVGITEANGHDLTVTASHTGATYFNFSGRHLNLAAYTTSGAAGQAQAMTIYGDLILGSGINSFTNSGSAITFASTSATERVLTSAGRNCLFGITFNGVGGRWRFTENWSSNQTAQILTVTAGTLNLNGFTVTMPQCSITGAITRAMTFGGGKIVNFNNNGTFFFASNFTNLVFNDASRFEFTYAGATGTRTIQGPTTGAAANNKLNIYVTAGTDIIRCNTNAKFFTIDFTGFSGSLGADSMSVSYAIFSVGMTITATANAITYTGYTGESYDLNFNSRVPDRPITIGSVGLNTTFNMTANMAIGATRTLTLTAGTLNLNTFTFTAFSFDSNNTNTRNLTFGTGSKITLTGNAATILNINDFTGLTTTGTSRIELTYAGATGSRSINLGTSTPAAVTTSNRINLYVTAGTDSLSTAAYMNGITDYTGCSCVMSPFNTAFYRGDVTFSPTQTFNISHITTLSGYSGESYTIKFNGVVFNGSFTITAAGATWSLGDAMTIPSTITLNSGYFNSAGYNVTAPYISSTGTTARGIIFGSSNWVVTAALGSPVSATGTNMVNTPGTGTIRFNEIGLTNRVFEGGGFIWPTLISASTGAITITGNNTFNSWRNTTGAARNFQVTSGSTQTFTQGFELLGTAGNLVTLGSTASGTHTLIKSSGIVGCNYLSLSRSVATGGATWYAGANSVNGGTNSGWIFANAPSTDTGKMFFLFNWD